MNNNIKKAIKRMEILAGLVDEVNEKLKYANSNFDRFRSEIDEAVKSEYPEYPIDGPEFRKAAEDDYRWSYLLDAEYEIAACESIIKDLEKLAGIK